MFCLACLLLFFSCSFCSAFLLHSSFLRMHASSDTARLLSGSTQAVASNDHTGWGFGKGTLGLTRVLSVRADCFDEDVSKINYLKSVDAWLHEFPFDHTVRTMHMSSSQVEVEEGQEKKETKQKNPLRIGVSQRGEIYIVDHKNI